MKIKLPFTNPEYQDGLPNAEIEAKFGEDNIHTTKALHWNISATTFALVGIVLLGVHFALDARLPELEVTVPKSASEALEMLKLAFFTYNWGSFVLKTVLVVIFGYITPRLSDPFVRAVTYTLGFTVSIEPGRPIRNWIYTADLKIVMAIMGSLLTLVYFAVWIGGVLGYIWYVAPGIEIQWAHPGVIIAVCLWVIGQWVAWLWWPASRIRVQSHEELFESLIMIETLEMVKWRIKLKKKLVDIAAPLLASQLIEDVRLRGPAALDDWASVSPQYYAQVARSIGITRAAIQSVKQAEVDGRNYVSVQGRDGTQMVRPAPEKYPTRLEVESKALPPATPPSQ